MHACTPVSQVSNRFTNGHVRTCNTSRSERNQLCVPTPHQTVHFNVCICTYVVMCDIIRLVGYCLLCHQNERICWPPNSHSKAHTFVNIEATQLKVRAYKSNIFEPDTQTFYPWIILSSSSRCYSFEVNCFGLSAITSITYPFAIGFITKPWNIRSSHGVKSIV